MPGRNGADRVAGIEQHTQRYLNIPCLLTSILFYVPHCRLESLSNLVECCVDKTLVSLEFIYVFIAMRNSFIAHDSIFVNVLCLTVRCDMVSYGGELHFGAFAPLRLHFCVVVVLPFASFLFNHHRLLSFMPKRFPDRFFWFVAVLI